MKEITKYIMIAFIIVTASFTQTKISQAASAMITISVEEDKVSVGDRVIVYINIKSDTAFGDFEGNLTYDEDILEHKGTNPVLAGGDGFLRIKDMNVSEEDYNRKYALEFEAIKVGTATIAFNNPIQVYDFETGIEMAASHDSLSVQVHPVETASNNTNLSFLKISPSVLEPEFDKNTLNYRTSVGYKTDRLVIDATGEDSNSIIKISGNDSLKEGENKVVVTVIAESGDVIEYTINVFRESAPEEGENPEEDTDPLSHKGKFEITEMNEALYAIYNGRYKLVTPGPEVTIPSGYIKTEIIISNVSIEVYAPENDQEFDFLLIYGENEQGEKGFYQYDRIEKTLQRYSHEKPTTADNVVEKTPMTEREKEYRNNLRKAIVVIAFLSVLCLLMMIISIRLYLNTKDTKDKSRGKRK